MTSEDEPALTVPDNCNDVGVICAALLAAGIGCLAMGIVTTLSEALKPVADILNFYKPVGPLSGKSLTAILIWLAAWVVLGKYARRKQINVGRWLILSFICVCIGALMTFPPFFDLFGDK